MALLLHLAVATTATASVGDAAGLRSLVGMLLVVVLVVLLLTVVVQLGDLVDLDRGFGRMLDVNVDIVGLELHLILAVVVGEGEGVRGVDLARLADSLLPLVTILDGHLAKLASVVEWTLAFIPGTAFATVDAG